MLIAGPNQAVHREGSRRLWLYLVGYKERFPLLKLSVGYFGMHGFRTSRGKTFSIAVGLDFKSDSIKSMISAVTLSGDRKNPKI